MSAISPLQYPEIAPLTDDNARPFWSVMIPAYKRTDYLERTLRSVLEQAPSAHEMQIEVVDNASPTDEIEQLVQRVGHGRVNYFRHETNLGMAGNWNSCIERARGEWIHILHDDDMVQPNFYAAYHQFIKTNPQCGMVFSRNIEIDANDGWIRISWPPSGQSSTGMLPDALYKIVTEKAGHFLRCPAVVVKRTAYEALGGFRLARRFSADVEMWQRIAFQFTVGYLHTPLALYRVHEQSLTTQLKGRENLIDDIYATLNSGLSQLSPEKSRQALPYVHQTCADTAVALRYDLHQAGKHRDAVQYALRAFHFKRSLPNLLRLTKSVGMAARQRAFR